MKHFVWLFCSQSLCCIWFSTAIWSFLHSFNVVFICCVILYGIHVLCNFVAVYLILVVPLDPYSLIYNISYFIMISLLDFTESTFIMCNINWFVCLSIFFLPFSMVHHVCLYYFIFLPFSMVHRVSGDRQRLYPVPVHHHDYPHPSCSELFPGISPRGHTDGWQLCVLLYR